MPAFFKVTIAQPGENYVHTNGQNLDVRGQLRNSTGATPVIISCRILDSNGGLQTAAAVTPPAAGFGWEFFFSNLTLPAGGVHSLIVRATVTEGGKLCSSIDEVLIGAQNP